MKNTGQQPAEVRLALRLEHQQDPGKPVQYRASQRGRSGHRRRPRSRPDRHSQGRGTCRAKIEAAGVVLSGTLPGGRKTHVRSICRLGSSPPATTRCLRRDGGWAAAAEEYWKKLFEPAMQIEIPDEFLANLIRASQVHCMLAARNQDHSRD